MNLPVWRSVAPVKEPFSWPNRIELDEIFRHGAAIDRDEGLGAPFAGAVNGAGDQFLADAGFAGDQHRDGGHGRFLGHAQHAVHAGALGDDVAQTQRAGAAVLHARDLAFERAGVERVAQRDLQPLGANRLDHEIDGAGAHRRDHIVDAAMRGLHDHRHVDRSLPHFGEHAEPVEIRHHQIENDAIDVGAFGAREQSERSVAVVAHQHLVVELLQHALKEPALHRIVVDDENGHVAFDPRRPKATS